MRKNKGFTLIELLSIIVIMGVIIVLAGPSMTRQFKKEEQNNSKILKDKIHNATKLYVAKYYVTDLLAGNKTIEITLEDLQNDGLINFKSNSICYSEKDGKEEFNNDTIIITVKNGGQIEYNYKGVTIHEDYKDKPPEQQKTNLQVCYGCSGNSCIITEP